MPFRSSRDRRERFRLFLSSSKIVLYFDRSIFRNSLCSGVMSEAKTQVREYVRGWVEGFSGNHHLFGLPFVGEHRKIVAGVDFRFRLARGRTKRISRRPGICAGDHSRARGPRAPCRCRRAAPRRGRGAKARNRNKRIENGFIFFTPLLFEHKKIVGIEILRLRFFLSPADVRFSRVPEDKSCGVASTLVKTHFEWPLISVPSAMDRLTPFCALIFWMPNFLLRRE